jgi:hypothetical protein
LFLTRRVRASAIAVVTLMALFGVTELISPLGARAYLDMLAVLARREAPMGLSLTGLLINTGLGFTMSTWMARMAALGLLTACWLRFRHTADERTVYVGTLTAALVASPIVWSHYLLLLVAALLVIASGCDGPGAAVVPGRDTSGTSSASVPLVTFTIASWFVVTPHRSTLRGLVLGGMLLLLLAAPALRTVGPGLARHAAGPATMGTDGPVGTGHAPRRRTPAIPTGMMVLIAATGILAISSGIAVQLLAAAHSGSGRVVGAYCVLLGMLAVACCSLRGVPTTER